MGVEHRLPQPAGFPLFYLVQLASAWLRLPPLWAGLYTVALPYTGYYALLYADRLPQSWRRARTFLRFLFSPRRPRLADEGRAIVARIRELGRQLEEDAAATGGENQTPPKGVSHEPRCRIRSAGDRSRRRWSAERAIT